MTRWWAHSAFRAGLLAACLSLCVAQPARSDIDPALVAGASAAYKEIAARLAEPDASNLPRLSQQLDGARLLAIFDIPAVVKGRPQDGSGLQRLMQWSEVSRATLNAYIFAKGAKTAEAVGANLVAFGEEISLATLFNLRLSVTIHQTALSYLASLPAKDANSEARQSGFKQMVLGIQQQFTGILAMEFSGVPLVAGSDVRAAEAFAQDLPIVAANFTPEQKAELQAALDNAIKQASPEAAKHLATAKAALK